MNQHLHRRLLWLALFLLSQTLIFSQGKIEITSTDSLTNFKTSGLDFLDKLAGDRNADHPYYTFLWIFGDGTFINGTRDSVLSHVFEARSNRTFHLGAIPRADVTIYATGIYSGGTRPPKLGIPPPGNPFRTPSTSKTSINLSGPKRIDVTPVALDTSVIDTTKTGALRLQLSKNVRPQDTLVNIISFRQPNKMPNNQLIRGQVLLFYNSKVKKADRVQTEVKKLFKNTSPPPPPPPLTHGLFKLQQSMVHFTGITGQPDGGLTGHGITEFKNAKAWDYETLAPEGSDERHLFIEFSNDSLMWELFKNDIGDTLKFLAVMTAQDFSSAVIGSLPNVPGAYLDSIGIGPLLASSSFIDGTFVPLNPDLQTKVIGISEVQSAVVSAHDPNNLSLYACECPNATQRKVVGVIDFSNDGRAPTTQLKVILKVPDQLNLNGIESVSIHPTPTVAIQPDINLAERTVTWTWPALLLPAESAGFGHPSTQGQIVFSIAMKPGFDVSQTDTMEACIVFDLNDPMCTLPVAAGQIITTAEDGVAQSILQCEACKDYPDEGATFDWWCYLLWALGILLLLVVIWLIKKIL